MGNLLLGKLFNWIKKQTDVLNFFKGLRNILKSSNLKIDKREKKNINFKNFFVSFLGILFSLFFSGYNTVFAGPPLNPVAFLVEQEIYIIPIFREIEIFSIEMIRLKKTKKGALGIRVMPLGDIFWTDVNRGMRGHRGFLWKGMLLDNRQPVEGLQIMTSTKNFPNSFPANVSDVDQYRPGSCRRSGLVSRFPIRDFMQLDIKDRAPQTTLEMQVRFYNEKNFQRNEKFYKKKRILPKNPKIYGNTSKSDHALSEMLGKEGIMRVQTFQKPDPFSSDSESDDDSCLTDVI